MTGSLNADVVMSAEAAVASGDELAGDYLALLEAQGEYAYAFDFFTTSMLWTVIAAALVFLMHLGFATLEAGLTQSKNTVNILFKNVFIICVGLFSYALIGFNTHYPGDGWIIDGWLAFGGEFGYALTAAGNADDTFGYGGVGLAMTGYGDFIFQAMFAATAATIVSGAVAERVKLGSFMIFATLLVAIAYPMVGAWHWGHVEAPADYAEAIVAAILFHLFVLVAFKLGAFLVLGLLEMEGGASRLSSLSGLALSLIHI